MSALLFVLAIEILGIKIRQQTNLEGFDLGFSHNKVKIIQYADDCVLCLNDKHELCTALSIINNFGKVSGLKMNLSKCEGLWLGKDKRKQSNCRLFGIKWPEQLRCLGIYVGHLLDKNIIKNWVDKIEKVEEILKHWQNRDLSLFGKVQIIKTFAVSQFVLPASLLIVPPVILKRIENVFFKFLWGSNDKVKRSRIVQKLADGGLNMVNLNVLFTSFKAVWITRILQCDPVIHSWAQLPYVYYKPFLECSTNLVFNIDSSVLFEELADLNTFYRHVLLSFNKAFVLDSDSFKSEIMDQCLWGNKFVYVRRKNTKCVLFLRNWIRSGINKISDLRFIDGHLDVEYLFTKVLYKSNILTEVKLVQLALFGYKDNLKTYLGVQTSRISFQ